MIEPWWKANTEEKASVGAALQRHAPLMRLVEEDGSLVARGPFDVMHDGQLLARFLIEVQFELETSATAHAIIETGGRIPRELDRHINTNGTCCIGVYGEWEFTSVDTSFDAFLAGPVRDFFLSQLHFEAHGVWPFGERKHGFAGMVECFAELMGVANKDEIVADTLAFLRLSETKGHWHCPCGSGARLRKCCRARLAALKEKWGDVGIERLWGHFLRLKRMHDPDAKEPEFSKA